MDKCCKIFVVDDDQTTALVIETILGENYTIETFESAADCLKRIPEDIPDLFLLDVQMPDMDGYELCRHLKNIPKIQDIPVVFISCHDTLEDVLAGYDAGAQDYVVKPFEHIGLQRKIENLLRIERERRSLKEQAQSSGEIITVFMACLDENSTIIKYLRSLSDQDNIEGVAHATLNVFDTYHLNGALQIRMRDVEKTFSRVGENWPMEIAVINNVRDQGRIFEFKNRSIHNFERISILVTNMPLHDSDLCGRIRDTLAIIAESADAKLLAIQAIEDKMQMHRQLASLLDSLSHTVGQYKHRYDTARYRGTIHSNQLLRELLAAIAHLGMTCEQEEAILELVRIRSEKLIDLFDFANEMEMDLGELKNSLESMLAIAASKAPVSSITQPIML